MLELFKSVKLDKNSGTPLYMQLSDKIAEMIENGILPADLKLPSIRQMSALLNVNSVTIVSCYKHLETKGYVYSRPGSGTYVAVVLPKQSENYSDRNIILDELYQSDDLNLINNGHIKINENMFNRAIQGAYTPGSTFKPLISIAGLETGAITPQNSYITDRGTHVIGAGHSSVWSIRLTVMGQSTS